jgi:hypothetical protein
MTRLSLKQFNRHSQSQTTTQKYLSYGFFVDVHNQTLHDYTQRTWCLCFCSMTRLFTYDNSFVFFDFSHYYSGLPGKLTKKVKNERQATAAN